MSHIHSALMLCLAVPLLGIQRVNAADAAPVTAGQSSHEPIVGSWLMGSGRIIACNKQGQAEVKGLGYGRWKQVGDSFKYEITIIDHGKYVLTVSKDSKTVDGYWQTKDKRIKNASGERLVADKK